jgi:hypothetical protein
MLAVFGALEVKDILVYIPPHYPKHQRDIAVGAGTARDFAVSIIALRRL